MNGMIYPLITDIVKRRKEEIEEILSRQDIDIALKTARLRLLARQIADGLAKDNGHHSINEFFEEYDMGLSPLIKLEGEGVRYGEVIILKDCPMAPLFELFKNGNGFPEYWKKIPEEYMARFKNEAILHPLCIIHQKFRDELASRIKKGNSVVHSVAVACRATSSGKIVYSEFGLQMAGMEKEAINLIINSRACAFVVK
ncbi:MAG: hypothetical protein ACK4TF_04305 [Thermodesulfovibrionales bacterium]